MAFELDPRNAMAWDNIKKNASMPSLPSFDTSIPAYQRGQQYRKFNEDLQPIPGQVARGYMGLASAAASPMRAIAGAAYEGVRPQVESFGRGLMGMPAVTQNAVNSATAASDSTQGSGGPVVPRYTVGADDSMQGQAPYMQRAASNPLRSVAAPTQGDTSVGGWNRQATDQAYAPSTATGGYRSNDGGLQQGLVQSQYNTMPSASASSLDPSTNALLSQAKYAAVGRGESLGGGTVAGYNDGGASAAVSALQEQLKGLDMDARSAMDGTLVGNWKGKQLMRHRDAIANSGANILGAQAQLQNSGTTARSVGNQYDLGLRHDITTQRGQSLGYQHGMAQVGATMRGQDQTLGLGLVHDNTTRQGQQLQHLVGMGGIDAHNRATDVNATLHAPGARLQQRQMDYIDSGDIKSLSVMNEAMGKMHGAYGPGYMPTTDRVTGEATGTVNRRTGEIERVPTAAEIAAAKKVRDLGVGLPQPTR